MILKKHLSLYIIFLYLGFLKGSVSIANINLDDLFFDPKDPQAYSLVYLDAARMSGYAPGIATKGALKDVAPYLSTTLGDRSVVSYSRGTEPKNPEKKKWLRVKKHSCKNGTSAFYVRLYGRCHVSRVLPFESDIFSGKGPVEDEIFRRVGSLLIFPQAAGRAMMYGFGKWQSLINHSLIVPNWGMRTLASEGFCDPNHLKEVKIQHFRKSTPTSQTQRTGALVETESFGLEVGSEGIEGLTLLPDPATGISHTLIGTDRLRIPIPRKSLRAGAQTIESLREMALRFYTYTEEGHPIERRLCHWVDQEIGDTSLEGDLNTALCKKFIDDERFPSKNIFVHDWVWNTYGKSILFKVGDARGKGLVKLLAQEGLTADTEVTIEKTRGLERGEKFVEPLLLLLQTLPMEYEGNFYRLNRGKWFAIDASRFGAIRSVLRQDKLSAESLGLPNYIFEHVKRIEGDPTSYEESNYNRDAVRKINENGGTALLLDRIDVRIGKSHTNVFELADIFVERDGEYFLIHVKRQHADDLSHHCEQLQRSAHYLSTQFAKRGAGQLLVRAALNGFYLKYDLSIVGLNGKRPTHTRHFTAQLREQGSLHTKIMKVVRSEYCDERMRAIFEEILSRHDLKLFSESEKSILATFDAIFDIVGYKDIIGDNETFYKDVETVLNQMFMALKAQRDLFSKGVMGKEERRKVTLVLAVVDDRKVYKVSKAYREKARLVGSLKKDLLDRESLLETKRVKLAEQKRKHAKEVALLSSKATNREKRNAKGRKQTCEKRIIKLSKEISQADANLGRERQQKQQRITVLEQELKTLEDAIDPNDIYTPERAFHDQNLWKLDETRMLIQKQEFGFKLMVINEGKGEEYDALGPLSDANGLELPLTQRLPLSPYDEDDSFEDESVEGNQDDKGLDDLFADDVVDEGAVVDMEVTVPPVSVEASPMSIMDSRKRKRILTQQEEKAAFGEERKKQKTSENVERSEELDQQFVLELQAMREKWPLRFLKVLRQGEGSAEITGI